MFPDEVAVRHTGEVVAHRPLQPIRADALRGGRAEQLRLPQVGGENVAQMLAGALVRTIDGRVIVEVLVEEFTQRAVRAQQRLA